MDANELLTLPCDVLVPAAVERVIDGKNAGNLRCRVLAEAANGPTTPEADEILNQRWAEIFVIPDILCNSGGVIVSYFEWVQDLQNFFWSDIEVTDRLYRILETDFYSGDQAVKGTQNSPSDVRPLHRGRASYRVTPGAWAFHLGSCGRSSGVA